MLPMTLIKQSRTRSKTQTATTLKIEHQTEIAMLLTAEDGSVWSRSGTSKKYRWERQRRAPARVASAPSNTVSIQSDAVAAVIIVRIVFISLFFFYCLLSNHIFPTNPNKITNCFKLFSLIAPASLF